MTGKSPEYSYAEVIEFLSRLRPILLAAPPGTVFSFGPTTGKVRIVLLHEDEGLVAQLSAAVPADALEIEITPGAKARALDGADSVGQHPPRR
jgi:hypothetical protein